MIIILSLKILLKCVNTEEFYLTAVMLKN